MSDEDFVATTDEKGYAVEYVPKSEVKIAFIYGLCVGVLAGVIFAAIIVML